MRRAPVFYDERESVGPQPPVAASFCGKATVRRPPPFTKQDQEGPKSVAPNSCPRRDLSSRLQLRVREHAIALEGEHREPEPSRPIAATRGTLAPQIDAFLDRNLKARRPALFPLQNR